MGHGQSTPLTGGPGGAAASIGNDIGNTASHSSVITHGVGALTHGVEHVMGGQGNVNAEGGMNAINNVMHHVNVGGVPDSDIGGTNSAIGIGWCAFHKWDPDCVAKAIAGEGHGEPTHLGSVNGSSWGPDQPSQSGGSGSSGSSRGSSKPISPKAPGQAFGGGGYGGGYMGPMFMAKAPNHDFVAHDSKQNTTQYKKH